jgi:hypothetical protein
VRGSSVQNRRRRFAGFVVIAFGAVALSRGCGLFRSGQLVEEFPRKP